MKFRNRALRYGAFAGLAAVASSGAFAVVGASGIDTTSVIAAITDGQLQGMVIALAMLALVIVFKIVKKVRGAA